MRQSYYGVLLSFYSDFIQMTGTNSAGVEIHGEYGPHINIDIDHEIWNVDRYETIPSDLPDSESITVQFTAPECDWNKQFSLR